MVYRNATEYSQMAFLKAKTKSNIFQIYKQIKNKHRMNGEPEKWELEMLTLSFIKNTSVPDGLGILKEIKYFWKGIN